MLRNAGWLARCAGPWLASVLVAVSGAAATAQPVKEEPVPVESFFAWPDMSDLLLSPSGRYVSVLVRGPLKNNALAVIDLEQSQESRAIVTYKDADIEDVHWVGDDWLVYTLQDPIAGSGERKMAPGLISIRRTGGDPRVLVKLRGNPFINADPIGVDRRLDYNHMLLFVPQDGSRDVIVGEITFSREGHIDALLPKRLNVESGRSRDIDVGTPGKVSRWLFDADGKPRLAAYAGDGRLKVRWRDPGTEQWTLLLDADWLQPAWQPLALDAAGTLYVTDARGAGGTNVLSRYDFSARAPAAKPAVAVPGFDFRGSLVSEYEGGRALGVRADAESEVTVWFDPAMKSVQDEVDRRLPGRVNRISCRHCDTDERTVLIQSWSDRDPGTYFVWRGRQGKLQAIGRRMKAIDPRRMAQLSFERIKARDGQDLPVWITEPKRADGAPPPPAVVLVHGGPWVRGGSWRWHELPQFLASRGWVVIEPEFRGSTGYGNEHFRAGWRQWGQAMQDDLVDAVRWAAAEKRIDLRRVCIAGGSYGGYATLMGLVHDPDLYRCGAAFAAVSEPMRMLEGSWWWRDDLSDDWRGYGLPTLLGDPKADAEMLKAASPLQQAARIKAPVLLVHGELDRRVPIVHAREMRDALRKNGQEPEWLVFPEEAHGWKKLENQRAFALQLEAFLARHLKP